MTLINSRNLLSFLLFTLLLFIYSSVLFYRPILGYDDPLLVSPIYNLQSISDYFVFVRTGKIFDFLPIRDLFYFFDIKLSSVFPWYSFQMGNFFLWTLSLFYLFRLSRIYLNEILSFLLIFLIGCSPVSVTSVAWISAKKHLLSFFFLILLLNTYLGPRFNSRKPAYNSLLLSFLVLMISFSQPINLPLFLFVPVYDWTIHRFKNWRQLIIPFIFMLLSLLIHFYYYRNLYSVLNSGISKTTLNLFDNLDLKLLSLGRFFYLAFFPFDAVPTPRYPGSWQNLFGLMLFFSISLITFNLFKKNHPGWRLLFIFFFAIVLSLLLPLVQVTNVFVSDTYFLSGQVFFFLFILFLLKDVRFLYWKYLLPIYILFLTLFSFSYSGNFTSTVRLFSYAVEKEPTPDNILYLVRAKHLIGDFSDTNQLLLRVWKWSPGQVDLLSTSINDVFLNPKIVVEKKIDLISKMKPLKSLNYFYLSILFSNNKNISMLEKHLPLIFENIPDFIFTFSTNRESFFGAYYALCDLNPNVDCEKHASVFLSKLKRIDIDAAKIEFYRTLFKKNGLIDYNPYK